ncbi:hypothetical protein HK096_001300, partial [Nowakowskiella sp. JEL0078]
EGDREAFIKNAKRYESFRHDNVVGIFKSYSDPVALILEFAEEGSLSNLLNNKIEFSKALKIAREISAGMDFLHYREILHGHLRSSKILLQNGIAKITDFGFYEFKPRTLESGISKHFEWISPEFITGGKYTTQVDIYAAGIIFYEIFTSGICASPYVLKKETSVQLLRLIIQGLRPTRPEVSQFSDEVWNLVVNMWHQQPNYRPKFRNVGDFLWDLIRKHEMGE